MEKRGIKDKILAIIVSLFMYGGGICIGVGIFAILENDLVFASAGFVQIYLYLAISILAALAVIASLALSFRNISLLRIFPSLVGPMSYIGLFFYFRVVNPMTIIPLIVMCLYSLYVFLRGTILLKDISSTDGKVDYLKEKHPSSYIFIYVGLGILLPSVLAFFSFIPSLYYLQQSFVLLGEGASFSLAFYDVIAWIMMLGGLVFSIIVDVPLFAHKLKKGDALLYQGGLCGKMRHPNVIGEIFVYLGMSISIFHFSNMFAFILFPIALFVYIFLVIYPFCLKTDSAHIEGYKEKWGKK